MTNLVFDLPNMLYRSLFVIGGFGKKAYTFDSQREVDELMRKIATDVAFIIRMTNPSRVLFALDTKSWRKDIPIEENDGYKAGREKSSYINWDNIFTTLNRFEEILDDNGMVVTRIQRAEADDLIALWTKELSAKGQHVVIVSGDEDVRQLIDRQEGPDGKIAYTTVFNPFMQGKNAARKFYVPTGFAEWLNQEEVVDIWNLGEAIDPDKADFCRLRDTEKVRMEEVDGNLIALRKVFCGDDGDNVPAMFTWLDDKKKEWRVTNSKFEKIYEGLKPHTSNGSIKPADLLNHTDEVYQLLRMATKSTPAFDMKKRIERQLKLVVLDPTYFPTEIVEEFDRLKDEQLQRPRPEITGITMNSMLQGTQYVRESKGGTGKGTEAGIFAELDRMNSSKSLF